MKAVRGGNTVWDNYWSVFDIFEVLPYSMNILGLLFEIEFLGQTVQWQFMSNFR